MKNIFSTGLLALAIMLIAASCGDEPFEVADGGSLGAIMAPESNITFIGGISTGVEVALNPYANEGITISSINVSKTLMTTKGNSEPVLYAVSGETFSQTINELYSDVPVGGVVQSNGTLTPGDKWELSYSMTLSDGRVMAIGSVTTITFQCAPYPGVWTVAMHDSYGDGWQTNDANGGDGIQVTLDGNSDKVLEVGLDDGYEGSGTITIPEGTIEASWNFPGDYYGEISFEIFGPDGSQVFASGDYGDQGAGILPIILCAP